MKRASPKTSKKSAHSGRVKPAQEMTKSEPGLLGELLELYPPTRIIENSYVLSIFWSWFTQIQWTPKVRIPLPRVLTHRDP